MHAIKTVGKREFIQLDFSHFDTIEQNTVIASVSEAIQYNLCRNVVLDCFAHTRNDGRF